jgi:hypothetical protein
MAKPYSQDLRNRVVRAVLAGQSRRKASGPARGGGRWSSKWRDDHAKIKDVVIGASRALSLRASI